MEEIKSASRAGTGKLQLKRELKPEDRVTPPPDITSPDRSGAPYRPTGRKAWFPALSNEEAFKNGSDLPLSARSKSCGLCGTPRTTDPKLLTHMSNGHQLTIITIEDLLFTFNWGRGLTYADPQRATDTKLYHGDTGSMTSPEAWRAHQNTEMTPKQTILAQRNSMVSEYFTEVSSMAKILKVLRKGETYKDENGPMLRLIALYNTELVRLQPKEMRIRMVIEPFMGIIDRRFLHDPSYQGIQALIEHIKKNQLPVDDYGRAEPAVIEKCYQDLEDADRDFRDSNTDHFERLEPIVSKEDAERLTA